MSTTKQDIQSAYQIYGSFFDKFYDGMVSHSTLLGKLANRMLWGFNKKTTALWSQKAMSAIPKNFSGTMLELPVGTGVHSIHKFLEFPNAKITCADYSSNMMHKAMTRAKEVGATNITSCRLMFLASLLLLRLLILC